LLGQIRRMSATSPEVTRGRIILVEDDPEAALFAVHVLTKRAQFDVTHTADPPSRSVWPRPGTGTWC